MTERFTDIAAGAVFSVGITSEGKLYSWGSGVNGQLGIKNKSESMRPSKVRDGN